MRFKKGHIPWNKGKYHTEEARRKMSEATKGRIPWNKGKTGIYSQETRCRMGEANRNRVPWNKDKRGIYSQETLDKISKAHKGKHLSAEHKRKIGKAQRGRIGCMLGKHHSREARRKISEGLKGDKSHLWKGGISFDPYPFAWTRELKQAIRQRDKFGCQLCGEYPALNVHHIDYDKGNCAPENLILLCRSCHAQTNHNRDYWTGLLRSKSA